MTCGKAQEETKRLGSPWRADLASGGWLTVGDGSVLIEAREHRGQSRKILQWLRWYKEA